jgi:HlyD family secretion protein
MNKFAFILLTAALLTSCSGKEEMSDAYGNFEVDKTMISAEVAGKLLKFDIEEGDILKAGTVIGQIDTMQLHYKKEQLQANLASLQSGFADIDAQMAVASQHLDNLLVNQKRIHKMFTAGAATQKQMDDIDGQVLLARKQLDAVNTGRQTLSNKIKAVRNQLNELNYTIAKSTVINPVDGTVLTKLTMENEVVAPGKPLYAIGNLSKIKLKVYVDGNMLPKVKLGNKATVLVDDGNGGLRKLSGKIIWISSTAEFTPKTIQTREERVNLVYAVKILVDNDGSLKIGMPGEVNFR